MNRDTLANVFGYMMLIPMIIAVLVGLGLIAYVIIDAFSAGHILGGLGVLLIVSFFIGGFGLVFTTND